MCSRLCIHCKAFHCPCPKIQARAPEKPAPCVQSPAPGTHIAPYRVEFGTAMKMRIKPGTLVGLLAATIALLAAASAVSAAVVYPVKVGPTGRYLVDQ